MIRESYKHLASLGNRQFFKNSRSESNFSSFEVLRLSRTREQGTDSGTALLTTGSYNNAATMALCRLVDSARASPACKSQGSSSIWEQSKIRVAVDFEKSMHQQTTRQIACLREITNHADPLEDSRRLEDVLSGTYSMGEYGTPTPFLPKCPPAHICP
jgi:hypothetical protein